MDEKYDIIVVGSGLGGLECGVILSKEGYKVCVVEQSAIFGGCLQSFRRAGRIIDTGIHYVGSMEDGGIMRQYLKYFGVFDTLKVQQLDNDFDHITLGDEGSYCYRQGYENFIEELASKFPSQREGLQRYCDVVRTIGDSINIDVHRSGAFSTKKIDYLSVSAVEFIGQCVSDPILQNILAGTNVLCGSTSDTANIYHHAMINHSNIEGAYRFVGGSQQLADSLAEQIRANGGTLLNRAKVVRFEVEDDAVKYIELSDGRRLFAKNYISNLHPMTTFNMVGQTPRIKKAYRTRLSLLPNTYGLFSVYLCMKRDSFEYLNKNLYFHNSANVWDMKIASSDMQPKSVLLSTQQPFPDSKYSDVITLMSPVADELFMPFRDTQFGVRPQEYEELKEVITQKIIEFTQRYYPSIMDNVESVFAASPLTYEHYTSTPNGSAYGIVKGYNSALTTLFPSRTKIENLYLTGQNLNVHGALGVTLTAATTCSKFVGVEYLAKKIGGV